MPPELQELEEKPTLAPGEKYPPEFRANALECLERNNGVLKAAAREAGVSPETLRNWAREAGQIAPIQVKLISRAVGPVVKELEASVKQLLGELPTKIRKATLKDSVDALSKLVPLLISLQQQQEAPPPGGSSQESAVLNKIRLAIKQKVDKEGVAE